MVTHAAFCCFVGLTWLRRSSLQVFSGLTGQQTLSPLYTHHTDSQNNGETSNVKWVGLIHYSAFFGSEGHVALDRNPGPWYDTLLLRMVPGDLLSAFPHRQFRTLPGLLDSRAALPNSNPNACMPMQGGSLYHFYTPVIWRTYYVMALSVRPYVRTYVRPYVASSTILVGRI